MAVIVECEINIMKLSKKILNSPLMAIIPIPLAAKKRTAFTLAEVLITITIIGVIAATVMPDIIASVNDTELKAAWAKSYSNLASATKLVAGESLNKLDGVFTSNDVMRDKYSIYMAVIRKCNTSDATTAGICWHNANQWKYLKGTANTDNALTTSRAILNSGMLLTFNGSSNCTGSYGSLVQGVCGDIQVDINGFKAPNMIGRDIFKVWVLNDGSIKPVGTQGDSDATNTTCLPGNSANSNNYGWGCSFQYLYTK